jgi:hypothetical protein
LGSNLIGWSQARWSTAALFSHASANPFQRGRTMHRDL